MRLLSRPVIVLLAVVGGIVGALGAGLLTLLVSGWFPYDHAHDPEGIQQLAEAIHLIPFTMIGAGVCGAWIVHHTLVRLAAPKPPSPIP